MPKKQFLKEKKKSKHAPSSPTNADEYLAAGVDFEEAGEKWRGGDAAKSTRFFVRAIDCYNEALGKFPDSFDLAYNKARVEYELTQYPKLLQQLPGSLLGLLKTALDSSRYALNLNSQNSDVKFNTAQILTSIVEASDSSRQGIAFDPLPLLEEALELFQSCLASQEASAQEYQEQTASFNQSQDAMEDADEGGVPISDLASTDSNSEAPLSQEDRWASIVEPITNDTLLDSLLAQLETLTTICNFLPPNYPQAIQTIQNHASAILETKFDTYLAGTGRERDAYTTRANFLCAFADAQFRSNAISTQDYSQVIDTAYSNIDLTNHPEGLCNAAESLIAYNASLRSHPDGSSQEYLTARWKALTRSLDQLTAASKHADADNVEKIHMARGDVELLRYQLGQGQPGELYQPAAKSGEVLLRNAGKFYRGSQAVAKVLGAEDVVFEGVVREALAAGLSSEGIAAPLLAQVMGRMALASAIIEEAVGDGLVEENRLKKMGLGSK